ncbi:MAG TPA: PEP-utilizing enzyme [Solirubrobacteraceae bacterium]|nr:PEP-utilizing enzyme [Solirubrobacteraceae bacterium]
MAVTQTHTPTLEFGDPWDPLHAPGGPDEHWSTDNVGEAAPGVLTPLGWSVWGEVGDHMVKQIAYGLGVFNRAERDSDHRYVRIFYGRAALQVEYLATVGDRMPGTTGEEAVASLFGRPPEDMAWHPSRRRYPVIAAKLPLVFARAGSLITALAADTDAWWRAQVARLGELDQREAATLFLEATARFDRAIAVQSICLLGSIQPLYDALARLIERTGVGDIAVLSGSGGAEMAIVADIWRASRGELTVHELVASHGFHGPREGELSARVWREDHAPLERVIAEYAAQDESHSPLARDAHNRAARTQMQRELLAAVPSARRPATRMLLSLAAKRIPLRGFAKRAFLQSLDICRGSARRAGTLLTAEGALDERDDIFYLTSAEWTGGRLPADVKELVARRRERRAEYEQLRIQSNWKGTPTTVRVQPGAAAADRELTTVSGLGVSAGVVEGTVRVVTDPAFADVEPGDVLVSSTTDPSWSSIMFISSALVVDIGGPLSHAAVVARELGVPCVVNTRDGTERLRTGDRVRVDGGTGTVEILERASAG